MTRLRLCISCAARRESGVLLEGVMASSGQDSGGDPLTTGMFIAATTEAAGRSDVRIDPGHIPAK
jgi:hypothetical protein